jgi:uncharacterized protein (DUF2267 family)
VPTTAFPNTTEGPSSANQTAAPTHQTAAPTNPPVVLLLSSTSVMQVLKIAISTGTIEKVSTTLKIDEAAIVEIEGTSFYIS